MSAPDNTELRLLGVLLDHNIAADLASALVHGSEFANPTLGSIFDHVVALRARGVAVDAELLPAHYIELGVPIPENVPNPALWSKHDPAGTAVELATLVHQEHLRRQGQAIMATGRAEIADRSIHPMTTMSHTLTALSDLLDNSQSTDVDSDLLGKALSIEDRYEWVIPELLEKQDRLVVTGPEGSGKSMLIRQLAIAASGGLHPFNDYQTRPVPVLVIDVENTERQWARSSRSLAIQVAQRGRRDPRQHLQLLCRGRLNLTDPTDLALVHRLVDRHKPEILAIGPLYKMVPGAITNDDDAAPLITALDGLRDRGLTLIMEAHAGHAKEGDGSRDMRPRGSSALMGWPEFGIGVRPMAINRTVSEVMKWRADRDPRAWPDYLRRGGVLPWTPATGI